VLVLAGFPVIVLLAANLYLFKTSFRAFTPRFRDIDIKSAKSLLNLGGAFFLLQIGALIIYQTDNIIITRVIGPEAVTTFNIAYKLFSTLTLLFTIVVNPYWAAVTDAYAKKDLRWIRDSMQKMKKIWLGLSIIAFVFFIFSDSIYKMWVGKSIVIDRSLSLSMAIYVVACVWQIMHAYMLNGTGKIKLQLYMLIITAVINIPMSVYLGRAYGLNGIVNANTFSLVVMDIVFTIQCKKLINQTAKGIWNR
jgi:O-antigen/teichoic acid export membrane protein